MSTPNKGSRRSTTDTTNAPPDSPRHDEAAPDRRTHSDPDQVRTTKRTSTNLVLPRSPLIGREHEVAAVQQLLLQEQVGLLTLTGPGGTGKTRLALQVAATLLDHFVEGVYFVSLAPIRDADLVSVAIADALGVHEAGGQSMMEALQAYLRHRQMLLVLDNFEQVVAAAPLVASLLTECGRLKVLVTSRSTLHLYGEQEFPVLPLALPDPMRLHALGGEQMSTLAQVASVALFVQRAMAVKPDFALNAFNTTTVAEICIGVDGLPLAIELAAAKVKLFSPSILLARLQQRLSLLTGGPRDLPARQRTLRDAIAWSYELLTLNEQVLFRRLAVFAGGVTLEAAQAVCNVDGDLGIDVLDGVASLVDQNLLKQPEQTRRGGGHSLATEARFHMLETVREYALEQLGAYGEVEAIRHHHASFFLTLAEKIAPILEGANQGVGLAQLRMEHDNLRSALAWSLADVNRREIALRLATALDDFWLLGGYWSEGRYWLEAALALTTVADHTLDRVLVISGAGALAAMQGDYPAGRAWLEEGLAISRELDSKHHIGVCLTCLSWIALAQHEHTLAFAQLGEALIIARELENKYEIGSVLQHLGNVTRDLHDYERTQVLHEEALALFQEIGADFDAVDILSSFGQLFQAQGDQARAEEFFRESLLGWQAMGALRWKGVANCLEGLAGVCVVHHQFEVATHLFGVAEALREVVMGSARSLTVAEERHTALRAQLGEAAFAAAWAAGRALAVEEAVDFVLAMPTIAVPAPDHSSSLSSLSTTYPGGLTAREVEVLRLLAQGLTYAQIADQLTISRRTVNAHLNTIYSKLEVNSRLEATRFAMEHHIE